MYPNYFFFPTEDLVDLITLKEEERGVDGNFHKYLAIQEAAGCVLCQLLQSVRQNEDCSCIALLSW